MANISTKFGLGASSGVHFTDAYRMMRNANSVAANIENMTVGGTVAGSNVVGFFTEMGTRGVADDSNWTADTYKTILTVTGSGLVSHVVGPTSLAGTPTTTFEITVDGVLREIAITVLGVGDRAFLGPYFGDNPGTGAVFTTAGAAWRGVTSMDASKMVHNTADVALIPQWSIIHALGTPCLLFTTSLLIRAKCSESNSTTANVERQSAVQYMRFT